MIVELKRWWGLDIVCHEELLTFGAGDRLLHNPIGQIWIECIQWSEIPTSWGWSRWMVLVGRNRGATLYSHAFWRALDGVWVVWSSNTNSHYSVTLEGLVRGRNMRSIHSDITDILVQPLFDALNKHAMQCDCCNHAAFTDTSTCTGINMHEPQIIIVIIPWSIFLSACPLSQWPLHTRVPLPL